MTGVLHANPDWLALQWFATRVLSDTSCPVVDLTDRSVVACPTCGHERMALSA